MTFNKSFRLTQLVYITTLLRECQQLFLKKFHFYFVDKNPICVILVLLHFEQKDTYIMEDTNFKLCDLNTDDIRKNLGDTDISEIFVLETVNSTNLFAKELASKDAKNNTIVIANHQTAGRGRLGREFFSPSDTGLYMSILIRNEQLSLDPSGLTVAAGVAVCRAISTVCHKNPQIKWVNDIFLDNRKVCGILAESGYESGVLSYIIVGIGLNISTEVFPGELNTIAGSLNTSVSRNVIAGEIIKEFYRLMPLCGKQELIDEYKSHSLVLGKQISFTRNGETYFGIATDINIEGNLIVNLESGETVTLKSGEVSLGSKNFI